MAKKKKTTNKNRVRKTKNKNTFGIFKIILVLFLILFLAFTQVVNRNKIQSVKKAQPVVKKIIITPYSTIKVSPTPVPLAGFCLKVPILTYHHIQPQANAILKKETSLSVDTSYFDKQMEYLISSGYTPIFANELINALVTHSTLPGKPVMVTMDDGYADNYHYALPILKKYNIKANLMLASGLAGSNESMLTWDQIREMKSSGLIYFTNHTWSHASIMRIAKDKADNEIDTAKNQIEQNTGQSVNIFTYPYGEFNEGNIQTLKNKGYIGAFTTIPGVYQCDSFIMTLHRSHIGNALLSAYGI